MLIEICCASTEDCLTAEKSGADRIELVSAHFLGGLTPSAAAIYKVREAVSIPIEVIIRPRMSGFTYSDEEFELMCLDARLALEYGADGIVFGFLNSSGGLDYEKTAKMLDIAGDCDTVFHRAIDISKNPLKVAEQLASLGVKRILTSGGKPSSEEGIPLIRQLQQQFGEKIEIMAGGGINAGNIMKVIQYTGVKQVHFGGTGYIKDASAMLNPVINFGALKIPPNDSYIAVIPETINEIITNVKASS